MRGLRRPALILALAGAAGLSLAATSGATPNQIDSHCSKSGDFCQQITMSKRSGNVKFSVESFTAAIRGEYTLCVKGPPGKECHDYLLRQIPDEEVWSDKVVWQKEFPTDVGSYVVKWKYMGDRLGHKLHFEVDPAGGA